MHRPSIGLSLAILLWTLPSGAQSMGEVRKHVEQAMPEQFRKEMSDGGIKNVAGISVKNLVLSQGFLYEFNHLGNLLTRISNRLGSPCDRENLNTDYGATFEVSVSKLDGSVATYRLRCSLQLRWEDGASRYKSADLNMCSGWKVGNGRADACDLVREFGGKIYLSFTFPPAPGTAQANGAAKPGCASASARNPRIEQKLIPSGPGPDSAQLLPSAGNPGEAAHGL
jgi:hypothetical protein